MKRKSILALALFTLLSASALITGCGNSNNSGNTAKENIQQGANDVTEGVKEGAQGVKEGVKEGAKGVKEGVENIGENVKYTAIDFKNDISKAGHELKDSADTNKDYFAGRETDYLLGNDIVRVYEYDSADKLNAAVKTISTDGMTINGKNVGFKTKPYYYTKGNSLIVYEGSNPAYINHFNTVYGSTII